MMLMLLKTALPWAAIVWVGCGCAGAHGAAKSGAMDSHAFPFLLRGADTIIHLDFSTPMDGFQPPHALAADEVCFMVVGSSTIECFSGGAALLLGPDDGIQLIDDNPLWQLRPARSDKDGTKLMKLYATFFLIAGSVEKLPGALADYLDDPGPQRAAVIALIRRLADDDGGQFPVAAHGGNFVVRFQLTRTGREKLLEALQALQEESGLQVVANTRAFR